MRKSRIVWIVVVLLAASAAEARPQRCQKVLIDAGRKYVAMIYATEHRDCTYRDEANCDKTKRRDHYVSLSGGKVPRKCSDRDVEQLVSSDLLQWDQCDGPIDQSGLGQCFLDFFESRAEEWVELIYESDESESCKDEVFSSAKRFLRAAGREEGRCWARKLRTGEHGSCAGDERVVKNLERQAQRFRGQVCGDPVLVETLLDLLTNIGRETVGFADDRYAY